jgi:hypothetical protein
MLHTRREANHSPQDDALVENGRISGNAKVDTPDGDIRGIPNEIDGQFNEDSFSFRETFRLYGHEITTTYAGRYIGPCNGRELGSGWRPPGITQ